MTTFRQARIADLLPEHGQLVDALRALVERRPGIELKELGEGVRHALKQRQVARPEQRVSELLIGRKFPLRPEFDALVRLCSPDPPELEWLIRRYEAAVREKNAASRSAEELDDQLAARSAALAARRLPGGGTRLVE